MPPGAPLPQSEIDVIRQWITDGATDNRVVVLDPITVTSLSPMPNAALDAQPANIVAGFSRELNQATVDTTTFLLTASGGDGTFADDNEMQVTEVAVSVPAVNPQTAVMHLTGATLADDTYEIRLLGGATNAIQDLDGNALDGEFSGNLPSGNGVAGGALPGSMNLSDEAVSLNSLVGVPSENDPLMQDRLEPGMPEMSYLMDKIDGTDPQQMPPSGPFPQEEVDAIRKWILSLLP
jgi:hypothetical protein